MAAFMANRIDRAIAGADKVFGKQPDRCSPNKAKRNRGLLRIGDGACVDRSADAPPADRQDHQTNNDEDLIEPFEQLERLNTRIKVFPRAVPAVREADQRGGLLF